MDGGIAKHPVWSCDLSIDRSLGITYIIGLLSEDTKEEERTLFATLISVESQD